MSFQDLGLQAELIRAISEKGYQKPTSIQRQAIPSILSCHDIMAGSQTGTGKTAGFALPVIQRLVISKSQAPKTADTRQPPIRALVLTPTRELAAQVESSIQEYSKYLPLKSTVIFGGVKFGLQVKKLRKGVDIVVATPGRLLDHVNQKTVDLSSVEILVFDEADRMLDMGFMPDIRKILAQLPKNRQTLFFSATFSRDIKNLANNILSSPKIIEVAKQNSTAKLVTQVVHPVDKKRKRELLSFLIGSNNWNQVLIFTRTKHTADKLSKHLNADGIKATAIHGNKTQGARSKALAEFKSGKKNVLVATDIAARGLDIKQLPHVINYELPSCAEDYIHRIGRTGRAGNEGEAISLVCIDELKILKSIERLIKQDIPKVIINNFEPDQSIKPEPVQKARGRQQRSTNKNSSNPSKRKNSSKSGKKRSPFKGNSGSVRRSRNHSQSIAQSAT